MGLFTPGYLREGKGVRKDEPKKKGIMRLFEILGRDLGDIVKLNFIFLISCIPIITIGPAIVALTAVMTKRVRDIPCFVFYEYKKAFKENFKQGVLAGLLVMVLLGFSGFSIFYYYSWHLENADLMYFALASVTIVIFVFVSVASCYLYAQIALIELPLKQMIKNSILLTIGFLPRSALVFITTLPVWLVFVLFFPFTLLIMPPLFLFSFTNLLVSMNVWPVLEKVFITNKKLADEEALLEEYESEDTAMYMEQDDDAEQ